MGFLSGAYGKIMAGKYLRTLQHKETMVQARLRRVTRQSSKMEKMLQSQERLFKNSLRSQYGNVNGMGMFAGNLSQQYIQEYQNQQLMMSRAQCEFELYMEQQRELQLEPLKDEEDSIQTELDSLKSQIQLAQAEYDAKKKEEQDGAKHIAPEYTGNGG